ncbi:uncharacterized protein DUF4136 [Luteimonas cucumeris]|uniref:Uncharacterized protein DUF4136 n=1 Tax=Luteimonas cucumeris TaxID=985012 RepID=A0A562LEV1_9GAMM|nr:DUF4136 domain-containing protein [Luteimonas cucumeris]TWI06138.1 uncharacterized protein DUF4136 [Luteimonas cucumeris]
MKPRDVFSWRGGLLLLFAALLSACATGPRIRSETDPEADFSRYRSWAFYEPIAMEENTGYSTWITDRIRANVRREMEARGFRYDAKSPDLKVNFQGILQDRTDIYNVPMVDYQYFYNYRARRYVAVPYWYDEAHVSNYTEGTLTIDLVDAQRNRLVWTGDAIGRVTRRSPQERLQDVDRAIFEIFQRFPFQAGSNVPVAPAAQVK